jgi:preprotein translocase subunit Sss1
MEKIRNIIENKLRAMKKNKKVARKPSSNRPNNLATQ